MNSGILFFFGERMAVLPLYEQLEARILCEIPDVKIKTAKTQITLIFRSQDSLCPQISTTGRLLFTSDRKSCDKRKDLWYHNASS